MSFLSIPMAMIMRVSIFNLLLGLMLLLPEYLVAQETDTLKQRQRVQVATDRHLTYVDHYRKGWAHLLPNLFISQYAGNIGTVSVGTGWSYGKHDRHETHLLLGYLSRHDIGSDQMALTLRQQYIPWKIGFNTSFSCNPFIIDASLNTIFSDQFWYREPIHHDYYSFPSKLRFHLGVGGRINYAHLYRYGINDSRLSFYYQLSTYDLAVISYVRSSHIPLKELFTLGIGINIRLF